MRISFHRAGYTKRSTRWFEILVHFKQCWRFTSGRSMRLPQFSHPRHKFIASDTFTGTMLGWLVRFNTPSHSHAVNCFVGLYAAFTLALYRWYHWYRWYRLFALQILLVSAFQKHSNSYENDLTCTTLEEGQVRLLCPITTIYCRST